MGSIEQGGSAEQAPEEVIQVSVTREFEGQTIRVHTAHVTDEAMNILPAVCGEGIGVCPPGWWCNNGRCVINVG